MNLIFKDGTLLLPSDHYDKFGLISIMIKETKVEEIKLDFPVDTGILLLQLLKSHELDYNSIIIKYDMEILSKYLELCNYLLITDETLVEKVAIHFVNIFRVIFKIEGIMSRNFYDDSIKLGFDRIRKLLKIKNEDEYFRFLEQKENLEKYISRKMVLPYELNFSKASNPVIWSKDVVTLIHKHTKEVDFNFFSVIINIHPQYRSYFTESEILHNTFENSSFESNHDIFKIAIEEYKDYAELQG